MRCFALSLMPLLLAAGLRADEASKRAKIEEFFRVAHLEDQLKQSMAMTRNQMKSGVMQKAFGIKPSADLQKTLDATEQRVSEILDRAFAWDVLKPEFVNIYAEAYTEEDMDAIVAFYKSSAGQKTVTALPGLMQKASLITQKRIAEVAPELRKILTDQAEAASKPKP